MVIDSVFMGGSFAYTAGRHRTTRPHTGTEAAEPRKTTGGPCPVAGGKGEVRQAAATGELVARAVAVVCGPVTFIRPTITRADLGRTRFSARDSQVPCRLRPDE
ncbi:hypothetical protein GCM10009837_39840 [Streptomyces durmitorensis]